MGTGASGLSQRLKALVREVETLLGEAIVAAEGRHATTALGYGELTENIVQMAALGTDLLNCNVAISDPGADLRQNRLAVPGHDHEMREGRRAVDDIDARGVWNTGQLGTNFVHLIVVHAQAHGVMVPGAG